jgi:hypothetical protein
MPGFSEHRGAFGHCPSADRSPLVSTAVVFAVGGGQPKLQLGTGDGMDLTETRLAPRAHGYRSGAPCEATAWRRSPSGRQFSGCEPD